MRREGTFMRTATSSAFGFPLNPDVLLASIFCLPLEAFAKRAVPENLDNGLDKLVARDLAIKAGAPATNTTGVGLAEVYKLDN
jgi:hypothetical protein